MDTRPILDEPSGRVMADVSSMFLVYILELYRWANDSATLHELWPNAKLAAQWHINISAEYGVPTHLVNTYDVLAQHHYDLCSYNSGFHLLAMAAARELALAVGDTTFAAQCQKSLETGGAAMDRLQWNETAGYYNSYTNLSQATNPGALMSDTFYSQVSGAKKSQQNLSRARKREWVLFRWRLDWKKPTCGILIYGSTMAPPPGLLIVLKVPISTLPGAQHTPLAHHKHEHTHAQRFPNRHTTHTHTPQCAQCSLAP